MSDDIPPWSREDDRKARAAAEARELARKLAGLDARLLHLEESLLQILKLVLANSSEDAAVLDLRIRRPN
ncbi:MAG TPA: hypothetical protein VMC10_06265 [Stellaceae bacterium]|nr:hypothetical protein [Stellaceae bacterium]